MAYLNGRQRPHTDLRTLQFSSYNEFLDRHKAQAPAAPVGLDYDGNLGTEANPRPLKLQDSLGNEEFLTCVPAAMLRLSQVWRTLCGDDAEPTTEQALALYASVSPFVPPKGGGKPAIPADGNEMDFRAREYRDYGAPILGSFKYWRNLSTRNAAAKALEPALAFLEIEPGNVQQLRDAIYWCHGVIIGLNLPRSILDDNDEPKTDWFLPSYGPIADATPGNWGSHCVVALGYSDRVLHCVGWNGRFRMSYPFLRAYAQEVWCVVPAKQVGEHPSFHDIEGLTGKLTNDLKDLKGKPASKYAMPDVARFWGGPNIMTGGGGGS